MVEVSDGVARQPPSAAPRRRAGSCGKDPWEPGIESGAVRPAREARPQLRICCGKGVAWSP